MTEETARDMRRGMYMWGEDVAAEIDETIPDPDAQEWTPGEPFSMAQLLNDIRAILAN